MPKTAKNYPREHEESPFSLRFLPTQRNALEYLMGAKVDVAAKFLKVFFVPF